MTTADIDRRRVVMNLMRELRTIDAESAEDSRWLDAIEADLRAKENVREVRRREIREMLEEDASSLRIPGSQHVDIPGLGRIQFRTTDPTYRLTDAEAFIAWARDHERYDLIHTQSVTTVKAADAKAEQAKHTETLPGIEEVPESTSMSIQWAAPAISK